MHGDFGRYIIGTNSESIPWSNRPLGDYISPAPEERWEDFLLTLSIEARQALKAWEESKITDVMKFNSSKLQSDNTGEPNEITPQEQYMEVLLLRLLTEEQRSTLKSTNTLTQDCADSSFDLRIAQSWIFLRCIQLGLTKDRFWKSDRDHYSTLSYNDKCKIERIGKKYQWIAYYEFLGLLADNYALKPPWNSSKSPEYLGPWLDLLRDIDPTCLTDGLSDEELPPICSQPRYDPDAFSFDHEKWLLTLEDLIDPRQLIERSDENGESWLTLAGFFEWESLSAPGISRSSVLHRYVCCQLQGYLIPIEEASIFISLARSQNFKELWIHRNYSSLDVYLREYPDSIAFTDMLKSSENDSSSLSEDMKIPILAATNSYSSILTDRDCSVKNPFTITLPSYKLVKEMNMVQGIKDGSWTINGQTVAFDPSVDSKSHSMLLIRRSNLEFYLQKAGLALVWTVIASKALNGRWNELNDRPARTEVNAVYKMQTRGITGRMWKREASS